MKTMQLVLLLWSVGTGRKFLKAKRQGVNCAIIVDEADRDVREKLTAMVSSSKRTASSNDRPLGRTEAPPFAAASADTCILEKLIKNTCKDRSGNSSKENRTQQKLQISFKYKF